MASCCPPGRGCNAPRGDEPCALSLCRAVAEEEPDARVALVRWAELQQAAERGAERRFRRRAFDRARDRALQALAMRVKPSTLARKRSSRPKEARVRQRPRRSRRLVRGAAS